MSAEIGKNRSQYNFYESNHANNKYRRMFKNHNSNINKLQQADIGILSYDKLALFVLVLMLKSNSIFISTKMKKNNDKEDFKHKQISH